MPSNRQRNAGAPLPTPLDGYPSVCFTMSFPDAQDYRAALLYVVSQLGKWYFWEKSYDIGNDRRATDAAAYLREFLLTATFSEECELSYEIRFVDCMMQHSFDGGETWQPVTGFDPSCFEGPQGLQGIPGEQGEPGECPDCGETDPTTDDNGTPPPEGTPGNEQKCKIAQGVVDSLIDNYYIPVLDFWIDVFVTQGLSAVQAIEALRLTLIGQTAGAIIWPPSAIGLIGSIGSALFGAMVAATSAAEAQNNLDIKNALNDTETREEIYCLLYNVLPDSGNIDGTVWNNFLQALFDRGGIPFIDLRNYLRDNIPLYVARTEAFITQGGDFDCSACNELCETFNMIWDEVADPAPEGWSSLGVVDTAGWLGDTTGITQGNPDHSCTRGANQFWSNSRVAVGGITVQHIGVKYVFPEPCLVEKIDFTYFQASTAGKRVVIAVMLEGGTMQVLENFVDGAPAPNQITRVWSGTPVSVQEVWFLGAHGGTSGAQTIRRCAVNWDI